MGDKVVLLYHEVADKATDSGFQNKDNFPYIHSVAQFERDLNVVLEQKEKAPAEVVFSFDDGGVSNLRSAEMLHNAGQVAYFFITTSKIGSSSHFLNKEEIRKIRNQGHIVGSHSHTHPMIFKNLSYAQMLEEWKVSKSILEEVLKEEITTCSIPGGDSDSKTYESALESGFLRVFDSEPIIKRRMLGEMEIWGRISIKNSVSERELRKILALESLGSLQRRRKIKKWIKAMIFPLHNYLQNRKNEVSY
ncbi:MAG: polysaccharide deacetylase family protein [Flavobacteriaceae bacterium]|nr:polysaccharide deacetylase family protein [Flavobacteriaceae bacterium]